MTTSSTTILLVEDNEDDVFIMKRALKKAGIVLPLQVVTDGQQALDYLGGKNGFADRSQFPLPGFVFLDLKLPNIHGFDVLAWIREHGLLESMRVIVLSSSAETKDVEKALSFGAHAYVVKPPEPTQLISLIKNS